MHNRKIRNFLKKTKPDSGFTLTELLTGLIMSIFVTGALGFGLLQILRVTAKETAKTNARNEASRAVEFISDEMRRASMIDNDLLADLDGDGTDENTAPNYTPSADKKVVLALNIPGLNDSIIYYLKSTDLDNWQGPQVLYRWGPPLNNNGEYTTGTWQDEALIDGIDNTPVALDPGPCDAGDTLTPPAASTPSGFYACVSPTNTTAQIFLTGGIDTIANNGIDNEEKYTAQTRAVARAREANVNNAMATATRPITFRSLEADYICTPDNPDTSADETTIWTMRTDFDNSAYDSFGSRPNRDDATTWIHEPGRQAQPINIDSSNDLIINSIPIGGVGCLNASSGNEWAELPVPPNPPIPLSQFVADNGIDNIDDDFDGEPDTHTVSHTIQLQADGVAYRDDNSDFWKSFNGNFDNYNNPNINGTDLVLVFKNGSRIGGDPNGNNIPAPLYQGYDPDGPDGPLLPRESLGEFLVSKGFATYNISRDEYTISGLNSDERIIAMEIGHTDTTHPGFDVQDNVFIMTHDTFAENHGSDDGSGEVSEDGSGEEASSDYP